MATHPGPKGSGPHGSPGADNNRFLMVMLVSMALLSLMQILNPPAPRTAPTATADGGPVTAATPPPNAPPPDGTAPALGQGDPSAAPTGPAEDPQLPEERLTLGTGTLNVQVSTWGGRVVSAALPRFTEHADRQKDAKSLQPVNLATAPGPTGGSLRLSFEGLPADASYRVLESTPSSVKLERNGAGFRVVRTLSTKPGTTYGITHTVDITNTGAAARTFTPRMELQSHVADAEKSAGGFLSMGMPTDQTSFLCRDKKDLMRDVALGRKDKEPLVRTEGVTWVGLDRQHFLGALLLKGGPAASECRAELLGDTARVSLGWAPQTVQPGQTVSLQQEAYFGPKQDQLLQGMDPALRESVDYGWFGALVRMLLSLLLLFHETITNFGICIVLLTLSIKLLTYPLTKRQMVSALQMKELAPKLKALQAKYADDRATLGVKQMELYKDNNVSPFTGCVPMLVQMPVWIALYRTLFTAVELYQQPFVPGWIDDLTQKDPFYILPVVLTVIMLVQAVMTPVPDDQQQMKYMQYGMPVFFGTLMIALPSGLTLYMVTNTVLTILQQMYIKRRFGTPKTATA